MVFDDIFSTVMSLPDDQEPPFFWNKIDLEAKNLQIPSDSNAHRTLQYGWLTPEELEVKSREKLKSEYIRVTFHLDASPVQKHFPGDKTEPGPQNNV